MINFLKVIAVALVLAVVLGLLGCAPVPMATYGTALNSEFYGAPPIAQDDPWAWHSQFVYPSVRCTSQGNATICRPI